MKYTSVRFVAPTLLGALALALPNSADAGWGLLQGGGSSGVYSASYGSSGYASSGYGSTGYTASYGSSGYASYGSSYASYGSSGYGSSGARVGGGGLGHRLRAHFAAKRARHVARRAAYGSSGNFASTGYAAYSYGSSGGSSGYSYYRSGYGSSGYAAPVSYGSSVDTSSYEAMGSGYRARYRSGDESIGVASSLVSNVNEDEVYLTVAVPSEAEIFVNGKPTTSTGTVRQFVSRGLAPNKSYKFELRAEMEAADGQPMVETKTITASAGDSQNVQFAFTEFGKNIETELVLHVPDGAEVQLGGNQTKAIGSKRTYRTSILSAGDVWDDYQIQVRYGDEVKSRTIRLIGGDQLQLTFAFDESPDKLAAR